MHLVLQVADAPHVLDALLERLDVAVHHRGRRRHAQAVGLAHDARASPSVFVFFGAMILRTRSTSTSPPPPGSESRPESRRRESVSAVVSFERREMCWISGGESACRWIL